jgi:hypothetical protein
MSTVTRHSAPRAPRAMDRYVKGRTLGEGTFGVVHEARVEATG